MMLVLLIAAVAMLLAGLLGIGFGIPVKEFSFGNTMIVTGVVAACTGMIMLSLWVVVRELKKLALQLGSGVAAPARAETARRPPGAPRDPATESDGFPFGREQPAAASPGGANAGAG